MNMITSTVTLEQLAADLAEAQQQIKAWENRRKATIAELEALHDAGQAPDKFQHAGISYTRQAGRVTYDYSAAPDVIGQQQQLKDAQEVAKALGLAIAKTGAPTWRVTAGKDA
jgi:hypothetical protein